METVLILGEERPADVRTLSAWEITVLAFESASKEVFPFPVAVT